MQAMLELNKTQQAERRSVRGMSGERADRARLCRSTAPLQQHWAKLTAQRCKDTILHGTEEPNANTDTLVMSSQSGSGERHLKLQSFKFFGNNNNC